MSTSEEMAAYIAKLSRFKNEVSEITQKTLQDCKQEYDRNKKIPIE